MNWKLSALNAFIHSPMRYAWDLFFDYRKRSGKLTRFFMNKWMPQIRQWDYISSQRIDTIIANSKYIARRIKKFWNRDAHVVYLPVDVSRFSPTDAPVEDYYVAFSRLVPYKRIDLAVSACKKLGKKLVVIGGGSEFDNLKKLADNDKNIVFFTGFNLIDGFGIFVYNIHYIIDVYSCFIYARH